MNDPTTYFITWTTYGTWLPGDTRGWRKTKHACRTPQPLLEDWCRRRMTGSPVVLNKAQREKVEAVCRKHADIRGRILHAINARTNHVQLVVTADLEPEAVRDQFKANATRVLRQDPDRLIAQRIWTRGGDCEIVDGEDALERVVSYVMEAQDRMDRGKYMGGKTPVASAKTADGGKNRWLAPKPLTTRRRRLDRDRRGL